MAKTVKKKATKKRASTYEPKVKFSGTFEDMIAISLTGAGTKGNKTRQKVKERFQASKEELFEIRVVEMENVIIAEINSIKIENGREKITNFRNDQFKSGTDINKILEDTRTNLRAQTSMNTVTKNMHAEADILNPANKKNKPNG